MTAQLIRPALDLATHTQLARDLDDLPELARQLTRHYPAILARGERGTDQPQARYPAHLTTLDLADTRAKYLAPLALGDIPQDQQSAYAWQACGGQQRSGILGILAGWVRLADEAMTDASHPHTEPANPRDAWAATTTGLTWPTTVGDPTITTEAGWLARHLDWIAHQPWAGQLTLDVRAITHQLERLVGPAYAAPQPDHNVVGTIPQIATRLDIPASTLYRWAAEGWLPPAGPGRPRTYYVRDAAAIRRPRRP